MMASSVFGIILNDVGPDIPERPFAGPKDVKRFIGFGASAADLERGYLQIDENNIGGTPTRGFVKRTNLPIQR